MQGHSNIIDKLNDLLTAELTAIDIYFVQSRILQNLGYQKLYENLNHEMEDEQGHAAKIIQRIIFLNGSPDVHKRLPFKIDRDVKKMFEIDLQYEMEVRAKIIEGIEICLAVQDYVTKEILEDLLIDTEEDHIDWLETQLSIINDIGKERYLAEKI